MMGAAFLAALPFPAGATEKEGEQDMGQGMSAGTTSYWFYRAMSCSEASFTTLNRGEGVELEIEEQAAHALAGGMLRRGHACGIMWGTALAAGARAREKLNDKDVAGAAALFSAARAAKQFQAVAGSINCRDITGMALSTLSGRLRYVSSGNFRNCARLAVEWAPQGYEAIASGLSEFDPSSLKEKPRNCAMDTMKKIGASWGLEDGDHALVAGFGGGLGLAGNACGALAAGICALGLKHYRTHAGERDTRGKAMIQEFTGADFISAAARLRRDFAARFGAEVCPQIGNRTFESIDDHSVFIAQGGCRDPIEAVGQMVQAL